MGISGPSSQSTFFKVGGVFFLLLSAFLVINIYRQIKTVPAASIDSSMTATDQKVLGAFNQKPNTSATTNTYTAPKGDTLFNIAQPKLIGRQSQL